MNSSDNREYAYSSILLAQVVTAQEVTLLWGKTYNQIRYWWLVRGKLDARKSLTDGTVLVAVYSIIALWGEPLSDKLKNLQRENGNGNIKRQQFGVQA